MLFTIESWFIKFIRPTPRSFFNCYNLKRIRLIYVKINSITMFKTAFVVVVWISSQFVTFFSTVPYLIHPKFTVIARFKYSFPHFPSRISLFQMLNDSSVFIYIKTLFKRCLNLRKS